MQCGKCGKKLGFFEAYYPDNSNKYAGGVCKNCNEEIKKAPIKESRKEEAKQKGWEVRPIKSTNSGHELFNIIHIHHSRDNGANNFVRKPHVSHKLYIPIWWNDAYRSSNPLRAHGNLL